MAPQPKVTTDGFLTEASLPLKELPLRTESSLANVYDLEARPFARGKFAQVKRCRHLLSGQEFAAKVIRRRRRSTDVTHEILHEVRVLTLAAKCDRIVKLHEVLDTGVEYVLILELALGGELQHVLDVEDFLPESIATSLTRQVLEGLAFLHERHIAHLDIKPQNILLTKPLNEGGEAKLCDFGISRLITEGCELREIVGTPDYVAPEVLHYEPISLATDLWSVGCLLYVLLTGHSPFGAETKQETFSNITGCYLEFPSSLFENVSPEAVDLIRQLLVIEPKQRLNCSEAMHRLQLMCHPKKLD